MPWFHVYKRCTSGRTMHITDLRALNLIEAIKKAHSSRKEMTREAFLTVYRVVGYACLPTRNDDPFKPHIMRRLEAQRNTDPYRQNLGL